MGHGFLHPSARLASLQDVGIGPDTPAVTAMRIRLSNRTVLGEVLGGLTFTVPALVLLGTPWQVLAVVCATYASLLLVPLAHLATRHGAAHGIQITFGTLATIVIALMCGPMAQVEHLVLVLVAHGFCVFERRSAGTALAIGLAVCTYGAVWTARSQLGVEGLLTPTQGMGVRVIAIAYLLVQLSARMDFLKRAHAEFLAAEDRSRTKERAHSEALAQFVAQVSHELRTPVAGVIGLHGLLAATPLDPEQRGLLARASQASDHLLGVVNDVLDLTQIESGNLSLDHAPLDILDAVDEVASIIQARLGDRDLGFTVSVDVTRRQRLGDARRIRQVLINLLGNAIRFTTEGSVKLAVLEVDGDQIRFRVSDTGIGMTRDQQGVVFEAFRQAEASVGRRFGGTGLGLTLTRHFCDAMGGTISLRSAPGVGTAFDVTLSLPVATVAPRPRKQEVPNTGPSLFVVVADDCPTNRLVMERALGALGHRVTAVASGRQALELVSQLQVDLVLMDLHMPDMNGIEATERIRCLPGAAGDTPVVALTAATSPAEHRACAEAGMQRVLLKPVSRDDLQAAVLDALTRAPGDITQRLRRHVNA